jgi:hypothetical protein
MGCLRCRVTFEGDASTLVAAAHDAVLARGRHHHWPRARFIRELSQGVQGKEGSSSPRSSAPKSVNSVTEWSAVRLWSLDPSYLDTKGLLALWREGLLARAVLRGATKGYRRHPQLTRFREQPAPVSAINAYLRYVLLEAESRGYRFDRRRLGPIRRPPDMVVSTGQLCFEVEHLRSKLRVRDLRALVRLDGEREVRAHPLFRVEDGPVAEWERDTVELETMRRQTTAR